MFWNQKMWDDWQVMIKFFRQFSEVKELADAHDTKVCRSLSELIENTNKTNKLLEEISDKLSLK